jgi:predicted TIM-barrel fold metal-dependent hydrolase
VVILHSDINMPFPKPDQEPYLLAQMKALFERHPDTTIIWAHIGVGRVVRPLEEQAAIVEKICTDPALRHVYFDISWDEVAKYATATPETIQRTADVINRFPDRFLFGSDVVAPSSVDAMVAVYEDYAPVWAALTPEASLKVRKGNYERLFDEARTRVRAWENNANSDQR